MTDRDFIYNFIEYCKECGYGSSFDQTELINSYLKRVNRYNEIIDMDGGEGKKTIHTLYDGKTVSFTKCWEDNEGFKHHIDGCSYECGMGHPK